MSKQFLEGSKPQRHCGHVIAFEKDGALYIKCRCCGEWVKLPELKLKESAKKGFLNE